MLQCVIKSKVHSVSFQIFFRDWLGHWNKSLLLKRVAAFFKRVAAFSNVQQHGEIINHTFFTFIVILFLPCSFWCYPPFRCVFINHVLCFYISVFWLSSKQLRMCVLNKTVWREVFEKFLRTKSFLVKFQTFS